MINATHVQIDVSNVVVTPVAIVLKVKRKREISCNNCS
jgi:flagellar motor component MotA